MKAFNAELSNDDMIIITIDDISAKTPIKDAFQLLGALGSALSQLQRSIQDMLMEELAESDKVELQESLSEMKLGYSSGPFDTKLSTSELTRFILTIQTKLYSTITPEGWNSPIGTEVFKPLAEGAGDIIELEEIRLKAESMMGLESSLPEEMQIIHQLYSEFQKIVTNLESGSSS